MWNFAVNDKDMLKTLVEAIPKILNWIILFKDSQVCHYFITAIHFSLLSCGVGVFWFNPVKGGWIA